MSKQRSVSWRPSDATIATAFEIALAQLGVRFPVGHLPYVTIIGNKDEGPVEVKTHGNKAMVYTGGKGEIFFYVEKIVFTALNEVELEQPVTVLIHNFDGKEKGNHLATVLTHHTDHREAVMYLMLGTVYGFELAPTFLFYLDKYPLVEMDYTNGEEFKLTYKLDNICGVKKIEIWYSRMYGYTRALINGKTLVTCEQFKNTWTVVK